MYKNDWDDPNFVFTYDESAKCCLRWKNVRKKGVAFVGHECGTHSKRGHWAVQFRGSPKTAHSIIWEIFNGKLKPGDIIRFNDGDNSNVKISNLCLEPIEGKNWQDKFLKIGDWAEVFHYEDGVLYWTDDRYSGAKLNKRYASKGDQLFSSEDKDGYLRTKFLVYSGSKNPMVHRIIYEYHFGKIPKDMQIDHIDGNPANNKIENLRCVTRNTNARNVKISSRNRTGAVGVRMKTDDNGCVTCYEAFWRYNGRYKYKSFNCGKYGKEPAFKMACNARQEAMEMMNDEYGDERYHKNHGKRY